MSKPARRRALARSELEAAVRRHAGDLTAVARDLGFALSTIYRAVDRHRLRRLVGLRSSGVPVRSAHSASPCSGDNRQAVFAPRDPKVPILGSVTNERARIAADRIDTTIAVSRLLWRQAKKAAIDQDCSGSEIVERALRRWLAQKAASTEGLERLPRRERVAAGERVATTVAVNKLLWREVKKVAVDNECTASEVVEQALRLFLTALVEPAAKTTDRNSEEHDSDAQ